MSYGFFMNEYNIIIALMTIMIILMITLFIISYHIIFLLLMIIYSYLGLVHTDLLLRLSRRQLCSRRAAAWSASFFSSSTVAANKFCGSIKQPVTLLSAYTTSPQLLSTDQSNHYTTLLRFRGSGFCVFTRVGGFRVRKPS